MEETVGCSWVVLNLDSQNAKYTNTEYQNFMSTSCDLSNMVVTRKS